jgi:hypothetical protein
LDFHAPVVSHANRLPIAITVMAAAPTAMVTALSPGRATTIVAPPKRARSFLLSLVS